MTVRLHEWQNPLGVIHKEGINCVGFSDVRVVASRRHYNDLHLARNNYPV
ncbi:hypothetical protein GCM10009504_28580 [Pseudomonas laurentiana]|nr:hypothetical protein GCM10009504_28580 [Pseudomonas laurentiana]